MLRVQKIMHTEVATCSIDANLDEVASLMWTCDCGAIPVVNSTHEPVGMITDRDIAMGAMLNRRSQQDLRVADVMNFRELCSCSTSDDIHDALKKMRRQQVRRLPVVDEVGRLAGMLSMRDIIRHASKKRGAALSYRDAIKALKGISK